VRREPGAAPSPYVPFLFSSFFRASRGSGPVSHSGAEGRTGGGGPGGLGVQGGFGKLRPRFRSLGACCRLFLAMLVSRVEVLGSLRGP